MVPFDQARLVSGSNTNMGTCRNAYSTATWSNPTVSDGKGMQPTPWTQGPVTIGNGYSSSLGKPTKTCDSSQFPKKPSFS